MQCRNTAVDKHSLLLNGLIPPYGDTAKAAARLIDVFMRDTHQTQAFSLALLCVYACCLLSHTRPVALTDRSLA
jgi:hypothetical protein